MSHAYTAHGTTVPMGRSLADGSPAQAHCHGVQSWETQLGMPVSPILQARKCHAQSLLVISVMLAAPEESLQESSSGQPWVEINWQSTGIEPKVKGTSFLGENKRCNHLERQGKFLILNDFLGIFNLPIMLHGFFLKRQIYLSLLYLNLAIISFMLLYKKVCIYLVCFDGVLSLRQIHRIIYKCSEINSNLEFSISKINTL